MIFYLYVLILMKEDSRDHGPSREAANEFIKNIVKSADRQEKKKEEEKKEEKKSGMSIKFDQDSYSECYPGYIYTKKIISEVFF